MKKLFAHFDFRHTQAGFTLVETLIAIFILALAIGALLTLTAGGYFSIRYAKNDIVATNLMQESIEYIRNTRDTAAQAGESWATWFSQYSACDATSNAKVHCIINPYATAGEKPAEACPRSNNPQKSCPPLNYYPDVGYYGYYARDFSSSSKKPVTTSFVRSVAMKEIMVGSDPQLVVTVTMDWLNGTSPKEVQQSIVLTKWNLQ